MRSLIVMLAVFVARRRHAGARRIGCRRSRPTSSPTRRRKPSRSSRRRGRPTFRAVRPAAAQPGGDEPRPRDGRLPAVQELAAAAAERVRDPADRAALDAAVRMERAPAARAAGRAAAPTSSTAIAEGRRPERMADDEEAVYALMRRAAAQSERQRRDLRAGRSRKSASRASSTRSASPATTRCSRW